MPEELANWMNAQSDGMIVVWLIVACCVVALVIGLMLGIFRRWRALKFKKGD